MTQQSFFTRLENRALLKISGKDRRNFLQGLITNDIELLKIHPLIYSCLLTPNGKFLFDFFVFEKDQTLNLDCEGNDRAQELIRVLSLYKLRADIELECIDPFPVYVGLGNQQGYKDPRAQQLGARLYDTPSKDPGDFDQWDIHRLKHGIPDGSRDMIPQSSTLLECRIDRLNGVSFEKGCFLGQELTARMHYRGLAKKHLYPIKGSSLPENGEDIIVEGKKIGQMRSSCADYGLALLKDEYVNNHTNDEMFEILTPYNEA